MVPCDEFQAADSVPIEIEKIEGKHEDIAGMQLSLRDHLVRSVV